MNPNLWEIEGTLRSEGDSPVQFSQFELCFEEWDKLHLKILQIFSFKHLQNNREDVKKNPSTIHFFTKSVNFSRFLCMYVTIKTICTLTMRWIIPQFTMNVVSFTDGHIFERSEWCELMYSYEQALLRNIWEHLFF